MKLSPGLRLRSQVCTTEIIVVKPHAVALTCGGHPMIPLTEEQGEGLGLDPALSGGSQIGKRYTDASAALELLVTKPGAGSLADGGAPLQLKEAKPLPSSD